MTESDPSRKTDYEIVSSPALEIWTSVGKKELYWTNCMLVTEATGEEYLHYFGDADELEQDVQILDNDFNRLAGLHYAHDWKVDPDNFGENDYLDCNFWIPDKDDFKEVGFRFRPKNTIIRIFAEPEYNHIEQFYSDNKSRGFEAPDWLIKQMFREGYGMVYLPYADGCTKNWYGSDRQFKNTGD